jgi:hypothetical protein
MIHNFTRGAEMYEPALVSRTTQEVGLQGLQLPCRRSQWPRGLRHEPSSLAGTLGSWVRIPLKAWMSVGVYSVFVLFCV